MLLCDSVGSRFTFEFNGNFIRALSRSSIDISLFFGQLVLVAYINALLNSSRAQDPLIEVFNAIMIHVARCGRHRQPVCDSEMTSIEIYVSIGRSLLFFFSKKPVALREVETERLERQIVTAWIGNNCKNKASPALPLPHSVADAQSPIDKIRRCVTARTGVENLTSASGR